MKSTRHTVWIRALLTSLLLASTVLGVSALEEDCVRGEPQPAFKAGGPIRSSRFTPMPGPQAREQVVFRTGEQLTLEHGGCLSYVVGFRYEGSNLLGADKSPAGVFKASAKQLRRLSALKPALSVDLIQSATRLEQLANEAGKPGAPKVGFWYSYHVSGEPGLIEHRLIVRGGGKTPDGRRDFLSFELSIGEL